MVRICIGSVFVMIDSEVRFFFSFAGFAHVGAVNLIKQFFEFFGKAKFQYSPGQYVLQIAKRIGHFHQVVVVNCLLQFFQLLGQQRYAEFAPLF